MRKRLPRRVRLKLVSTALNRFELCKFLGKAYLYAFDTNTGDVERVGKAFHHECVAFVRSLRALAFEDGKDKFYEDAFYLPYLLNDGPYRAPEHRQWFLARLMIAAGTSRDGRPLDGFCHAFKKEMVSVPLLPRHDIHLVIGPCAMEMLNDWPENVHGYHFAECFRATWLRLPPRVRGTLLRYWRKRPGRFFVRLTDFHLDTINARACCSDRGFLLEFRTYFDRLQPSAACVVIAHELAHAYLWASGRRRDEWSEKAEEKVVRQLTEGWGFRRPRSWMLSRAG
jgi:hypothetical protein